MATKIQIKRTNTGSLPSSLSQGELVYVYDTSNTSVGAGNNGGRIFIGDPTSASNTPLKIGGEYYTNLMDHTLGTLTADAALLVDSNKKIDNLKVDNLDLDGNSLTSTDTNGDINITPNGTGKTIIGNLYVGNNGVSLEEFIEDVTGGQITAGTSLTATYDDAAGTLTIGVANAGIDTTQIAADAVTTAKIADANVTTAKIADLAVTTDKLNAGAVTTAKITDSNVTTAKIADQNVTADKLASDSVTTVKIANNAVTNAKLANSAITIGTDATALGGSITDLNGLTSVDIDNITVDGNTIETTDTDGNLNLSPNGEGTVKVPSGYEGRTSFTGDSLVNKTYVDNVASGLDVKESVRVATTGNLDATYSNGGGTLTGTNNGAIVIDGVTLAQGDRVLVKDQTSAVQNGFYKVTTTGGTSAQFVLTRTPDADSASEINGGAFTFVEEGTLNADNGYVATHNGEPVLGTDDITFEQFSGAGQVDAGDGLTKTGNTLDVNVDGVTIEIVADDLQIKDSAITNAKVSASAAIAQSKLAMTAASTRGSASGIGQADLGLVSFDSAQFTLTNGWASVTTLDGGTY